uniref:Uncharacterized protein n=1 Tax=Arundo donax TaxID=35708 RepID=A0A0A8ZWC1_ARUDO
MVRAGSCKVTSFVVLLWSCRNGWCLVLTVLVL